MMTTLLISLLLAHFHSLSGETVNSQKTSINGLDESESKPFTLNKNRIKGNLNDLFEDPFASVNIDYLNNALIVQFRRSIPIEENGIEEQRRSSVDKNFMRFGRNDRSLMRFGKRQPEVDKNQKNLNTNHAETRSERSESENSRNSRGDNFMRFGRSDKSLMRFGRAGNTMMNSEGPANSGRSFMRFGKRDGSLMRFGRAEKGVDRVERGDGFMRLGRMPRHFWPNDNAASLDELNNPDLSRVQRGDGSLMRFGRSDTNFMRFGKLDQNFMRFGKRAKFDIPESRPEPSAYELGYIYKSGTDNPERLNSELKSQIPVSFDNELLENEPDYSLH